MSSESKVTVVRLGEILPLENSDSLAITQVHGGYPCIVRRGQFEPGSLAAYVPVDILVPTRTVSFAFLAPKSRPDGFYRVRAQRLRGTYSMGLLVAAPDGSNLDNDVTETMGCLKWEAPADMAIGGDNEADPGLMPVYTDVESLRRWLNEPGVFDSVFPEWVLTEKIHGANARYCFADGRLWVGSRTGIKRDDSKSIWWVAARNCDLAEKLAPYPEIVIYGEVYGQVQDLKYGVPSGVLFVIFDILDRKTRTYLGWDSVVKWGKRLGLPVVPEIERVLLWNGSTVLDIIRPFAEGQSILGPSCIREGVVLRPALTDRSAPRLGRVILKLVGEGYHTRKGT